MNDDFFASLIGCTLELGQPRYRLQNVLGAGATAVVFLAVDPQDPENKQTYRAIKVAKAGEQWKEALKKEWDNLRRLETAERRTRTHYFPRAHYPEDKNQNTLWQGVEVGGERVLMLVQDFISGIGVHDLLLDYGRERRLPEPLALEIALQYAEMLTILHGANLTCVDRKLDDLRWHQHYAFRAGEADDLARWQRETPGRLMVLDWNVTAKATAGPYGTMAQDLFRFGVLWHRMLLGIEPRFRVVEVVDKHETKKLWQLEEPLEKQVGWQQISFGTREILSKLLHPVPKQRYKEANTLHFDVEKQVKLWQRNEKRLHTLSERDPFAAVDLLRVKIEAWGSKSPPRFDRVWRASWHAATVAPFRRLEDARLKANWETALKEIARLNEEFFHDSARCLQLDRHKQIIEQAQKTSSRHSSSQTIKDLFKQSNTIYRFDRGLDQESEKLSDEMVKEWKKEVKNEPNKEWQTVRQRLWWEADYRLGLIKARSFMDSGDYREAQTLFGRIVKDHNHLKEDIQSWLDRLYGNPSSELEKVNKILERGQDVKSVRENGLKALVLALKSEISAEDPSFITGPISNVARVLQGTTDHKDLESLFYLYSLLNQALVYCRIDHQQVNITLKSERLKELHDLWHRKFRPSVPDSQQTAVIGYQNPWTDVEDALQQRQNALRERVLHEVKKAFKNDQLQRDEAYVKSLVQAYHATWGHDKIFVEKLEKELAEQQKAVRLDRDVLSSARLTDGWQQRIEYACRRIELGQAIANMIRGSWHQDITVESFKQIKANLDEIDKKLLLLQSEWTTLRPLARKLLQKKNYNPYS